MDSVYSIPSAIHFYEEGDLEGLDLKELGDYLTQKTEIPCFLRGNLYQGLSPQNQEMIAKEFVQSKVVEPSKRLVVREPFQREWEYEKRRIQEERWKHFGILYDGFHYHRIVSEVIPPEDLHLSLCVILFTNQLIGTWDWNDRRYHARVSLYGFPSILSVTGIVEAPAKPKEFYFKKQMGVPLEVLKEKYKGQFVDYGDSRLTEIMKGYVFQALFFHMLGEPFCGDPDCRLFNSHWQEEVLRAQMGGRYEFCPTHERLLDRLIRRKIDRTG